MAAFVDQPPAPHLADFVDAVGELIAAILDIHRSIAPRKIAAVDVGNAGHVNSSEPGYRSRNVSSCALPAWAHAAAKHVDAATAFHRRTGIDVMTWTPRFERTDAARRIVSLLRRCDCNVWAGGKCALPGARVARSAGPQ